MAELRGWAFPVELEPLTGRIKEISDDELTLQSIKIILSTMQGERFYYKDFGCGIQKYIFEPANYATLNQIESEVKASIEKWEHRVTLIDVKAFSENAERIYIDISYKIQNRETVFHYRHNVNFLE